MPVAGMSSIATVPRWRGTSLTHTAVGRCRAVPRQCGAAVLHPCSCVWHVKHTRHARGGRWGSAAGVAQSVSSHTSCPWRSRHTSSRRHAASRRLCPSHTPEQRPVPIARRSRLRLSLLSFFPTGLFWGVVGRSQRVEVVVAERDGVRCCVSLWDGTGMSVVLVGRRLLCRSPCDLL